MHNRRQGVSILITVSSRDHNLGIKEGITSLQLTLTLVKYNVPQSKLIKSLPRTAHHNAKH